MDPWRVQDTCVHPLLPALKREPGLDPLGMVKGKATLGNARSQREELRRGRGKQWVFFKNPKTELPSDPALHS